MFLKIIKKNGVEVIRECEAVCWNPLPSCIDESKQGKIVLNVTKKGGDVQVDLEYNYSDLIGVYYMSESGKTIDSKQF
jgi:hypothetical protein